MLRLLLAILFSGCSSSTLACQSAPRQPANVVAEPLLSDSTPASWTEFSPGEACAEHDRADNWFLMRSLRQTGWGDLLQRHRISVYGWTEGAFTASSAARRNLPLGFNYRANDFLLQQNWLRLEQAVDEASSSRSFGFRSDTILPGSDYQFTRARGLGDDQTGSQGIDPVQLYAQIYCPNIGSGLDLKLGRFFAQFGVESVAAIDTPFVSRAYNFIYNPYTHTGLLATLRLGDSWSMQHGLVTGSDVFFDSAAEPTYLGGLKYESGDGRTSVLLATVLGPGEFNQAEDFSNPRIFDLVLTQKLTERWTWKLDALYGYQTNVPGTGTASWSALVNYWSWAWRQDLQANFRVELFDDSDGNRTGFPGLYTAATAGVSSQLAECILLRPEIRCDLSDSSRPFSGSSSLLTSAVDLIVRW